LKRTPNRSLACVAGILRGGGGGGGREFGEGNFFPPPPLLRFFFPRILFLLPQPLLFIRLLRRLTGAKILFVGVA